MCIYYFKNFLLHFLFSFLGWHETGFNELTSLASAPARHLFTTNPLRPRARAQMRTAQRCSPRTPIRAPQALLLAAASLGVVVTVCAEESRRTVVCCSDMHRKHRRDPLRLEYGRKALVTAGRFKNRAGTP